MNIVFKKDVLKNLNKAIEYEWIERNEVGAYAYSTIIGMNTRREHGLFVVPSADYSKKIVLLSKFEESIFVDNQLYDVSTNQYSSNIFPQGFNYLESFKLDPFPIFTFKVEDRVVHKKVFLISDKNILVVRYELKNQGRPIKLIIKPFLTARFNQALTDEIQGMNTDSYLGQYSVRWAPKANMPQLYAFYNKGEYVAATLWYHKFYFSKDSQKYATKEEDLLNPGFFQVTLNAYESFDLFLSLEDIPEYELDFESLMRKEIEHRNSLPTKKSKIKKELTEFKGLLRRSLVNVSGDSYISVSSIQNNKNLRDILFSMPGLFLAQKDFKNFKNLFIHVLNELDGGLLPLNYPNSRGEAQYAAADLSLWLINLVYLYLIETNDFAFIDDNVFESLRSIVESYTRGTRFNIYTDRDDLLFVGDKNINLSWLPLKAQGAATVRFGKLLEINALWYNTLCIMALISKKLDKNRYANKYAKLSSKIKNSFCNVFINEGKASLFDSVLNETKSEDFNINQIVPLALPFRCIEEDMAKKILTRIESELLTPYGMRIYTKANGQKARPDSSPSNRERQLIKPFAIVFYIQACMNYKPMYNETIDYFQPLYELSKKGLIGYVPEIVINGDEITQNGMLDYTTSLANLVWIEHLLER